MKDSGFLARDYVAPTICQDGWSTDAPGYFAWTYVNRRSCDRGTICRGLVARFKEGRARVGPDLAVSRVRYLLSGEKLSRPDDERLFTAVVAGELTEKQFGVVLCSKK